MIIRAKVYIIACLATASAAFCFTLFIFGKADGAAGHRNASLPTMRIREYVALDIQSEIWELYIMPDGSGGYGAGSDCGDRADCPPKSFDFDRVAETLLRNSSEAPPPHRAEYICVRLTKPDGSRILRYCSDSIIPRHLIEQAHDKATQKYGAIEEYWANSPPFKE